MRLVPAMAVCHSADGELCHEGVNTERCQKNTQVFLQLHEASIPVRQVGVLEIVAGLKTLKCPRQPSGGRTQWETVSTSGALLLTPGVIDSHRRRLLPILDAHVTEM